jgi:hypothetical protein
MKTPHNSAQAQPEKGMRLCAARYWQASLKDPEQRFAVP